MREICDWVLSYPATCGCDGCSVRIVDDLVAWCKVLSSIVELDHVQRRLTQHEVEFWVDMQKIFFPDAGNELDETAQGRKTLSKGFWIRCMDSAHQTFSVSSKYNLP